jgi:CRP-like cAMP-binding protein
MTETRDMARELGRVPLFASLSKRALQRLVRAGGEVDHSPGKEVTEEGGRGVGFHLILDGTAAVEVHGRHRRDLGPGEYFGEISVLDGKPRSATVRVGDQGLRTFSVTAWEFGHMLDENPEIARPLLLSLCERLRAAEAEGAE